MRNKKVKMIAALMAVAMSVTIGTSDVYAGTKQGYVGNSPVTGSTAIQLHSGNASTNSSNGVNVSVSASYYYRNSKTHRKECKKASQNTTSGHAYVSFKRSENSVSISAKHFASKGKGKTWSETTEAVR